MTRSNLDARIRLFEFVCAIPALIALGVLAYVFATDIGIMELIEQPPSPSTDWLNDSFFWLSFIVFAPGFFAALGSALGNGFRYFELDSIRHLDVLFTSLYVLCGFIMFGSIAVTDQFGYESLGGDAGQLAFSAGFIMALATVGLALSATLSLLQLIRETVTR